MPLSINYNVEVLDIDLVVDSGRLISGRQVNDRGIGLHGHLRSKTNAPFT